MAFTLLATVALWQAQTLIPLMRTWQAVCLAESGADPHAVGDGGRAVGIAQIHPVMVADCNRIAGRRRWTCADRTDPGACFAMFATYCLHYYPAGGPEQWARAWNGGPTGPRKASTKNYWLRVRSHLERL